MRKISIYTFIVVVFSLAASIALADRGTFGRKDKKKVAVLDFAHTGSLRNAILSNLRAGFVFKGTQTISQQRTAAGIVNNSIMSFKRGNTMYVLPLRHKIIMPEYNKATGYKLVLRSR
jgi:hypothetical protein